MDEMPRIAMPNRQRSYPWFKRSNPFYDDDWQRAHFQNHENATQPDVEIRYDIERFLY